MIEKKIVSLSMQEVFNEQFRIRNDARPKLARVLDGG